MAEPSEGAPKEGLLDIVQSLLHELPGLVSDRVELLSLELLRAGKALAQMVALVVAAAILGVTAWLALWVGVGALLVSMGLHWSLALLIVLIVNIAAAWSAVAWALKLAPLLRLPATQRHLTRGTAPLEPRNDDEVPHAAGRPAAS